MGCLSIPLRGTGSIPDFENSAEAATDLPVILLNEFLASNGSSIQDEDGEAADWIELYNPNQHAVDLGGWGLTDTLEEPFRWQFPEGTEIGPHGFLVVWASGKDRPGSVEPSLAPDAVPGLVLWLQSDATGRSLNQSVPAWPDLSGQDNHAVQSLTSQQPTLVHSTELGRPVVHFNRASQQQLFLPTTTFSGMSDLSDFTFLAVARWNGNTISGLFGGYRGNDLRNSGSSVLEINNPGGQLRLRVGSGAQVLAPETIELGSWHLLGASMNATSGQANLFVDGQNVGVSQGVPGSTTLAHYQRVPIGSSHDDARTWNGMLAEVLLFNRPLEVGERQALENYLGQRYSLHLPSVSLLPHTNFRIAAAGERLALTRPDGSESDAVGPIDVPRDVAYGRTRQDPEVWAFLGQPTPGEANSPIVLPDRIEPVEFSHPSGIYQDAFDLVLSHPNPNAVLVYTLDGSEPDIENVSGRTYRYRNAYNSGPFLTGEYRSQTYENPITVRDRSPEPNRISLISTTSDANPSYFPRNTVRKGTVVRAKAFVPGGESSVSTSTYFVSNQGAFDAPLPIVSLALNEDQLFDYDQGIYVAGVDHVTRTGGRICEFGNFNRRGEAAERAAHFQYFEGGALVVDQGVGIRIHGNCSRRNPFKSLRLYARSLYDPLGAIHYPFFDESLPNAVHPDNQTHNRLVLRSPNINELAFCRLFQPVYEGVGGRLQPAFQFINGEFWGICLVRERFDSHFLANNYNIDRDRVVMINIKYGHELGSSALRVFNLDQGEPEDMTDFLAMRQFITQNDMANPDLYAQAESLLSMESFVDHLILKIFSGDDHYAPEYVFWKAREAVDGGMGDGRWRVFVKDFDSTLRTDNYVQGLATGSHPRPFGFEVFRSLLQNPQFRDLFINRFADLLNAHFRTERFLGVILSAFNEVAPYWDEVHQRWNGASVSNPNRPFTATHRQNLVSYAQQHPARQRQHLRQYFNLGNEGTVTVDVSDSSRGGVQVHSIPIHPDTPGVGSNPYPWSGTYFAGVPVPLRALPNAGSRFVGWRTPQSTDVLSSEPEIWVDPAIAPHRIAVFEPVWPIVVWDFSDADALLEPSYAWADGRLAIVPGPESEIFVQGAAAEFPSNHLRVNNPLGTSLTFSLPTTGLDSVVFSYLTRRSGMGAGSQTLAYTTDGITWVDYLTYSVVDAAPVRRTFDLSGLENSLNNPNFAIRITFEESGGSDGGNHRFSDFRMEGTPGEGTVLPPQWADAFSDQFLITAGMPVTLQLAESFVHPNGLPMAFTATSSSDLVKVFVEDSQLELAATRPGEARVTVGASDGSNQVEIPIRVLAYPQAHRLADGPYTWTQWASDALSGEFPSNMIFLQGDADDSTLATPLLWAYEVPDEERPYGLDSRTRIQGLAAGGVSFINTGRGRDLGGALLALDTRDLPTGAHLAFTAGTVLPNSRSYALRLQGRSGIDGPFEDLQDAEGRVVEYVRHPEEGHVERFTSIPLPNWMQNQPYVQLLWRYHHVGGLSGPRSQLRLDDVVVAAAEVPLDFEAWRVLHFSNPNELNDPAISGPKGDPTGAGISNLVRHALGLGPEDPVEGRLPWLEFGEEETLEYVLPYDPVRTDLVWRVTASTNLVDWSRVLFDSTRDWLPGLGLDPLNLRVPLRGLSEDVEAPGWFLRLELD